MSITRYNDTKGKPTWSSLMDDFINESFFNLPQNQQFFPSTNIVDEQEKFELKIALPGFTRDDVEIKLEGNILTISSEIESDETKEEKNYTRKEYNYQSFTRSFTLPNGVDAESIEANFEHGELIVSLPKLKNELDAKKIEIQ